MGNTCDSSNYYEYSFINNTFYNNLDELAKHFIQSECIIDDTKSIHSMVLLQAFQNYVKNNTSEQEFNDWIESTTPQNRLHTLIENLHTYNIILYSFETINGIQIK